MCKSNLFSWLLLSLLLVLAQLGVATHEIGHFSDQPATQHRDKQSSADKFCEQCLEFAQIGGAVTPTLPAVLPPPLVFDYVPETPFLFIAADAPTSRSRDPPAFL